MIRRPAPETRRREPQERCCAKCRTPYNCGNAKCACHGLTLQRLLAKETKR